MAKMPYSVSGMLLDDGRMYDDPFMTGQAARGLGLEQTRQRRSALAGDDARFGRMRFNNRLDNPTDDAYFGILQAKENLANAAGKSFGVNPNSATDPDFTTATGIGQTSLAGITREIEGPAGLDQNARIRHNLATQRRGRR